MALFDKNDNKDILEFKETEVIDGLYLELSQFTKAANERDVKLNSLLMSVVSKFPGESRFETALRYIKAAERLIKADREAK